LSLLQRAVKIATGWLQLRPLFFPTALWSIIVKLSLPAMKSLSLSLYVRWIL
jgi:hypothetical protein